MTAGTSGGFEVEVVHLPVLCFVMEHAGVSIVRDVVVRNRGLDVLRAGRVMLSLVPDLGTSTVVDVPDLHPGEDAHLGAIDLRPPAGKLRQLLEAERARLQWVLAVGGEEKVRGEDDIEVLAYNEWPSHVAPELLTSFVTPNHPVIMGVLRRVADALAKETGDGALNGYQARSKQRVIRAVEALHRAAQSFGIGYVELPASFSSLGQKIRLADAVLADQLGNCVDVSVLFASCLEQMGLRPILVLVNGHAFLGVWLIDEFFPEGVVHDAARLRTQLALGNLLPFDATVTIASSRPSFEAAIAAARTLLDDDAAFMQALDVRALRAKYLPLPIRDVTQPREVPQAGPLDAPANEVRKILSEALVEPEPQVAPRSQPPSDPAAMRFNKWQEKLLDLSLRNRLLSFSREAKTVLPLEVVDLAAFEDRIAQDDIFEIVARPDDQAVDAARQASPAGGTERQSDPRSLSDFGAGRIGANLQTSELWTRSVALDRAARTAIEEGGANVLFIAVGLLRWFETQESDRPRLAPLLLYPAALEFERRKRRVRLRRLPDDPVANVTLVEKMMRDFGLDLAPMADLQPDEAGVDVPLLLRRAREAVQRMPRWEVLDQSCVGLFSFTKFLMWKDLRDNAKILLRAPVVRHLTTGTGAFVNEQPSVAPERIDEEVPPETVPCVVDADSTQIAAVAGALRGRSFVLQGPPGTGKSQTITNLIAATLAQGKTVLFVSEKMAALDVVRRRLNEVGIGDFCLELHSSKANKKVVLDSLAATFNRTERRQEPQWIEQSREVAALRDALNAYAAALHRPRPLGLTLHQVDARLLGLQAVQTVRFAFNDAASWTGERFRSALQAVTEVADRAAAVEPLAIQPWRECEVGPWSAARQEKIEDSLAALSHAVKHVDEAVVTVGRAFNCAPPAATAALEAVIRLARSLAAGSVPPAAATRFDAPSMSSRARALVEAQRRCDDLQQSLAKRWTSGLVAEHLVPLKAAFDRHASSSRLVAFVALFGARRQLRAFATSRLGTNSAIAADLACALELVEQRRLVAIERAWLAETLQIDPPGETSALAAFVDRIADVSEAAISLRSAPAAEFDITAAVAVPPIVARAVCEAAQPALAALTEAEMAVRELLRPSVWPDRTSPWHRQDLVKLMQSWSASMPKLRAWCNYREARSLLDGIGLAELAVIHQEGKLPASEWVRTVEKSFLSRWSAAVRDSERALRSFDGAAHHRTVDRFRRLDREHVAMARDLIAYRLEQQLPRGDGEHAESSEAGILLRETCKKTRHMAIRRLLHEIPHLVRKLKPCMLMSPLSIAQYLPADGHQFDVVVFDEASQIATHDAIGAIARGKQVIVVGDSKQLPPTSFFMRQGDDENATPDENDVVEVESILDEAYAKQLPSQMLGWHYRSRHEALINFSNQQYYGGSLHVFPAAQSDVEGLGITLSHVRDGIYESGASARVNRAEAQALVDALVDRLKRYKPDERSFGVVTFSVAQQALVQDLLDERRSAMPEIEAHFTGSEGVFVKNLENVQGDERDEILFSICYAKDAEGKLRMHFGPLSIAGGERRLNVAITRARKQLRVFSTLTADQIDLRRTTSTGAAHLKAFLEYAARKGRPAELEGASSYPTTFEQQMAQVIEACGRTVKTQIGCGGYRIDLAVEGPHRGAFSVAVEGDGRAYAGARSARDRDRLRWELLKGLGWNLHRVWSADWSESRAREEARLIGALQRDETEAPARHLPEPSRDLPLPRREICVAESASMQFNHAPEAFHPNPYQSYEQAAFVGSGSPAQFYSVSGAQLLQTSMLAVIDAEGPVHFELAARRLIERWGIERLTGRPRERIEGIVHHLEHQGHIQRRGDILWPRTVAPTSYLRFRVPSKNGDPRDIQHIATQEIANAAAFVLSRELSIAREELVRATARLFGCARVSRSVSKSVDDAIELLVKTGRCTANDERVSLPS